MIQSQIKKIMNTGIQKYAKKFEVSTEDVQIQITVANGEPCYKMCKNWQPVEDVTFNDIQDKPFDLLGFDQLSGPFITGSLEGYAKELKTDLEKVSAFVFKKGENLGIAIYNATENVKVIPLAEYINSF